MSSKPKAREAELNFESAMDRLEKIVEQMESGKLPLEELIVRYDEGMNLVKAWRKYLGLTQAEVARRAAISQAALSQMERADSNLRNTTLEKLAKAMGLSVDQLTD